MPREPIENLIDDLEELLHDGHTTKVLCPHCNGVLDFSAVVDGVVLRSAMREVKDLGVPGRWPRLRCGKLLVPLNVFLYAEDDLVGRIARAFNTAFDALPQAMRDRVLRTCGQLPEWAFIQGNPENEFCFGPKADGRSLPFAEFRTQLRALLRERLADEERELLKILAEDRAACENDEEKADAEADAKETSELARAERASLGALMKLPAREFALCLVCIALWDDGPLRKKGAW